MPIAHRRSMSGAAVGSRSRRARLAPGLDVVGAYTYNDVSVTKSENFNRRPDGTIVSHMRLSWRRCTLQKDLHTMKFFVEGTLERGIARRLACHVADVGFELAIAPREVAPADDLVAP